MKQLCIVCHKNTSLPGKKICKICSNQIPTLNRKYKTINWIGSKKAYRVSV